MSSPLPTQIAEPTSQPGRDGQLDAPEEAAATSTTAAESAAAPAEDTPTGSSELAQAETTEAYENESATTGSLQSRPGTSSADQESSSDQADNQEGALIEAQPPASPPPYDEAEERFQLRIRNILIGAPAHTRANYRSEQDDGSIRNDSTAPREDERDIAPERIWSRSLQLYYYFDRVGQRYYTFSDDGTYYYSNDGERDGVYFYLCYDGRYYYSSNRSRHYFRRRIGIEHYDSCQNYASRRTDMSGDLNTATSYSASRVRYVPADSYRDRERQPDVTYYPPRRGSFERPRPAPQTPLPQTNQASSTPNRELVVIRPARAETLSSVSCSSTSTSLDSVDVSDKLAIHRKIRRIVTEIERDLIVLGDLKGTYRQCTTMFQIIHQFTSAIIRRGQEKGKKPMSKKCSCSGIALGTDWCNPCCARVHKFQMQLASKVQANLVSLYEHQKAADEMGAHLLSWKPKCRFEVPSPGDGFQMISISFDRFCGCHIDTVDD